MEKYLNQIINHVFLPMELPQQDDEEISADIFLAEEVLKALQSFEQLLPQDERSEWHRCIGMVEKMLVVRQIPGGLMPDKLEQTLADMTNGGSYK